jgi:hypothetical protein
MVMDMNNILDDLKKITAQVGQNQEVAQDLMSGKKKLAIVPGSGPSFVVPTASTIAVGVSALPILAVIVAAMVLWSSRRR